jgi:PAS domain-containing protein
LTTVIESDHRLLRVSEADRFGLSDGEVSELFASNRLTGYYRQDLAAGHLYFSEQACVLYGIEPTTGPVNLVEVLGKIHKDDIELMLLTLEERVKLGKGAHYIFRVADGAGGWRHLRIISAYRDNGTPAGEVAGVVYALLDRVPGVQFQHRECFDAD